MNSIQETGQEPIGILSIKDGQSERRGRHLQIRKEFRITKIGEDAKSRQTSPDGGLK